MNKSKIDRKDSRQVRQNDSNSHASFGERRNLAVVALFGWGCVEWRHGRVLKLGIILFAYLILAAGRPYASELSAPTPTIAILDFELNDLTLTPGLPEEQERTASIGPLLRGNLESQYGFELVAIDSDVQEAADESFGYLFDHHDVAAELGRKAACDWIVVGRVHKASFLFVYLRAQVISTKSNRLIANLTVEVKGPQKRLTTKGVERLAEQIAAAIKTELEH